MKIEWKTSNIPINYEEAVGFMENRVEEIFHYKKPELIWLLEHPSIYTAGSSASADELVNQGNLKIYNTGRGGKYTYHGPGQRIVYLMLDLRKRGKDLHKFVEALENWIIAVLEELGISSRRKSGRIGVWCTNLSGEEAKIAAIGIRVRKWIAYHGISINVSPDLAHYKGIIPCGIKEFGVTSLKNLGFDVSYQEFDRLLKSKFHEIF